MVELVVKSAMRTHTESLGIWHNNPSVPPPQMPIISYKCLEVGERVRKGRERESAVERERELMSQTQSLVFRLPGLPLTPLRLPGLPVSLKDVGVAKGDLEDCARRTMHDPLVQSNPRKIDGWEALGKAQGEEEPAVT